MPKKKSKPADSKAHLHKARVTKSTLDFKLRIERMAFKPHNVTWEQLAKELGISVNTIHDFGQKHKAEIEARQREVFTGARAEIEKALVDRSKGMTIKKVYSDQSTGKKRLVLEEVPPEPKAIQYFFERCDRLNGVAGPDDVFDILAQWYPLPAQAQFLFHYDPFVPDQMVYLKTGIGYGKTDVGCRKAILLARLNRGLTGMIAAPTYKILENPIKERLARSLEEMRVPFRFFEQKSYVELWGDTKILLRSFDNPENLRGPNIAWCWADELRLGDSNGFNIIAGRIREPRATHRQFAITSTPNGFDFLYDKFENPDTRIKSSVIFRAKTEDNIYLPKSFVESLYDLYDEKFAKQELEGESLNIFSGRIYYNFDRNVHVGECPIDPTLPIHIGQDFNYNPLCGVVCQIHKNRDGAEEVWVIDETHMDSSSTDQLCQELTARGYGPIANNPERVLVYPDASGTQKTAAAGSRSNIEIMRQSGFGEIYFPRANARVLDRYNSVNGMLRNAHGNVRMRIDKRCKFLIRDMEQEVYKEGSNLREDSKNEAKLRGHNSDALGYFIHYRYKIEAGSGLITQ